MELYTLVIKITQKISRILRNSDGQEPKYSNNN